MFASGIGYKSGTQTRSNKMKRATKSVTSYVVGDEANAWANTLATYCKLAGTSLRGGPPALHPSAVITSFSPPRADWNGTIVCHSKWSESS